MHHVDDVLRLSFRAPKASYPGVYGWHGRFRTRLRQHQFSRSIAGSCRTTALRLGRLCHAPT
jgi:hypothetical protein